MTKNELLTEASGLKGFRFHDLRHQAIIQRECTPRKGKAKLRSIVDGSWQMVRLRTAPIRAHLRRGSQRPGAVPLWDIQSGIFGVPSMNGFEPAS